MATPLTRAEWLDECAKLAKTYEEAMTSEAKRASLEASPFRKVASETQDPRFTTRCYQQAPLQPTCGDSHDQ